MKVKTVKNLLGVASIMALAPSALGSDFELGYHENFLAKIGTSVSRLNLRQSGTLVQCYDIQNKQVVNAANDSNSRSGETLVRLVESEKQLDKHLKLDSEMKASFAFASFEGENNIDKKMKFDEKTVNLLVYNTRTFSKEHLDYSRIKLNEDGKEMLDYAQEQKDPELFFELCGDHIVTEIQKGAKIAVVYKLKSTTKEEALKVKHYAKGKYLSFEGSLNIEADLKKKFKNLEITHDYVVMGVGKEVDESVGNLVKANWRDLNEIKNNIGDMISNIDVKDAQPVSWGLRDVSKIPELRIAFRMDDFSIYGRYVETLMRLKNRYFKAISNLNTMNNLEDNYNSLEFQPDGYKQLKAYQAQFNARINELGKLGNDCLGDRDRTDCKMHNELPIEWDMNKVIKPIVYNDNMAISGTSFIERGAYVAVGKGELTLSLRNTALVEKVEVWERKKNIPLLRVGGEGLPMREGNFTAGEMRGRSDCANNSCKAYFSMNGMRVEYRGLPWVGDRNQMNSREVGNMIDRHVRQGEFFAKVWLTNGEIMEVDLVK